MPPAVKMVGFVKGRLRVLRRGAGLKNGSAVWVCLCDPGLGGCGKLLPLSTRTLRHKPQVSCGCYRKDRGRPNDPPPERRRPKKCRWCKGWYPGIGRQLYCNPRCRRSARCSRLTAAKGLKPCLVCGWPVGGKSPGKRRYCSVACHDLAR